jgi:imidazolonepropionase
MTLFLNPQHLGQVMRTILVDIGPLAHLSGDGPLSGLALTDEESLISHGKGIVIERNVITKIGNSEEVIEEYGLPNTKLNELASINSHEDRVVSLEGRSVVPGLVDAHSHIIWAGDRSREVRWKLDGKSYSEIASMGGGIVSTVNQTRSSSDFELFQLGKGRIESAFSSGTTHIESKSGYGLNLETELRLLEVSKKLSLCSDLPSIDHTWLGAHAIPDGMAHKDYFESLISEQLPAICEQGIARSTDVFCEPGWFTVEESEEILRESRNSGLNLRLHIDEFCDGGGGDLAAEMKVDSADHAHYTNDEARAKMNDAGVNTGFLPGTPYSMGKEWPDFNKMIDDDLIWSIATDFNPNNQILSIPFLSSLLVSRCGVDPLATLVCSTRNPAETTPHPSGLKHGRIEVGAVANLNILDSQNWESWCTRPSHSPFLGTVIEGKYIAH